MKQNSLGPFMFAVLAVSAYLLVGSVPVCASEVSDATRCRVVDLMPPFWRFWDAAKGQPQGAQLLQFDEMVVKEYPEVYRASVLGVGSNGPAGGTAPAYVATILEDVTLSPNRNSFGGNYLVTAYDLTGHFLQVISKGKVTGTRISITDLAPDALF